MSEQGEVNVGLSAAEAEFIQLAVGGAVVHRNKLGHGGGGNVRHVRTPAGSQFYGLPIGAIITADVINKKNAEHAAQGLKPPTGALTPEKAPAVAPGEIVNKAAGGVPNVPGGGKGKGGGPSIPGGGSGVGGGKGGGPVVPGAAGAADEPNLPKLTPHKSTIKGPNKFTTGGAEYSAPKDSRIFRPTSHPDAMAYVMEPNGKLHAFTQAGEIDVPPIVDKVLTEKFAQGFSGDDHYLQDAFENNSVDLNETKTGDVLSDASGPQFTKLENGDFQHNQLGSLHDAADLQKHVDSGDLTLGVGSNQTESGPSLAEMDKPTLKKFLKKLPEGQHLEHTDKGGKVTQIVKGEDGFQTSKGEPVGDGTLFLLRDKLSVVNDADSPVKGASKKKLDKLKEKLAAPAKPKVEKVKAEKVDDPEIAALKEKLAAPAKKIPADAEPDLIEVPKAEKKVPEAAKPKQEETPKSEAQPKAVSEDGKVPPAAPAAPKDHKEDAPQPTAKVDDTADKEAKKAELHKKLQAYVQKKKDDAAAKQVEEPKAPAEKKTYGTEIFPDPQVGHNLKDPSQLNALGEGSQVAVIHHESGDEHGLYTKKGIQWLDANGTMSNTLLKALAKPAGSQGLVVKKVGAEAKKADVTPPAEPPKDVPAAVDPADLPIPKGTPLTTTSALRHIAPGGKVRSTYTQGSGSGTFSADHTFTKHEDGSFRHDGGNFLPQSPGDLRKNFGMDGHTLTADEDLNTGHYDAVHVGDSATPAYFDQAKEGDSVDVMSTSGGTPYVDKHLIKQADGTWVSEDGSQSMTKMGLLDEQWHTKVGIHHDATPAKAEKPDETDAALAEGDDLINEIENDPKADEAEKAIAELEPKAFKYSIKPGESIKGVEQLDAAPVGTGIHYHKNDGELTLWNKISPDEDGKDFIHGDGTKVKGKHLANSLKNNPDKLTLAHHAPDSDEEAKAAAAKQLAEELAAETADFQAPGAPLEKGKKFAAGDIQTAVEGDALHYPANFGMPAGKWEKTGGNEWTNSATGAKWDDKQVGTYAMSHPGFTWNEDKGNEPEAITPDPTDEVEQAIAQIAPPKELELGDIVTHEDQMKPGDTYSHVENSNQKFVVNPDGTLVGGAAHGVSGSGGQKSAEYKATMIAEKKLQLFSKAQTDEQFDAGEEPKTLEDLYQEMADSGLDQPTEEPKSPATQPPKVGDEVQPEHLPLQAGTILTSDAASGIDYEVQDDGGIKVTSTGSHFPASTLSTAVAGGGMKVKSLPDHEHPEFKLDGPNVEGLVMHKANVQKAIDALEGHTTPAPKYALKSVPDNDVTKNLDKFNELAKAKYPKPTKPKQALINYLKDSIGVKHTSDAVDVPEGEEKHTFQQKTGAKEFSTTQVQHAISALESSDKVQVKSILAAAGSPLAELDQHQLIGFIKDKPEQKAKYISFLKKKIGANEAEVTPDAPQQINVASPAAEKALEVGDPLDKDSFEKINGEPGHLVRVADLQAGEVGESLANETFQNTGHGAWKNTVTGSVVGADTLAYIAHQGNLTYHGKNDGGLDAPESTPAPEPAPTGHPSGVDLPAIGEELTSEHMDALTPGDTFEVGGLKHTVMPDGSVASATGTYTWNGPHEFKALADGGQITYGGKVAQVAQPEEPADPFKVDGKTFYHGKEQILDDAIGQKYVLHGSSQDYKLIKKSPMHIQNPTTGVEIEIGAMSENNFLPAGKWEKVDQFPGEGAPAYTQTPNTPEITNPEHAPAPVNGIGVGKYSTKTGKAYMVVNGDGTGTFVSAQGVAKAIDAAKVKANHDKGMNTFHGVVADDSYPKPDAAGVVAAAAPKKITSVEKLPDGVYTDGANGQQIHVVGDTVNITHEGQDSTKNLSAYKAKFLKGQILDQWGNSILPKQNYGQAKVFGSPSTVPDLGELNLAVTNLIADPAQFQDKLQESKNAYLSAVGHGYVGDLDTEMLHNWLQQHGIYIPQDTLKMRAESLYGADSAINRARALRLTLDQMLGNVPLADHTTDGAGKYFDFNGVGQAKPPLSLTNDYYDSYDSSLLTHFVKNQAAEFGGGGIIGQHSAKMTKSDKQKWAKAYAAGDFAKMFAIEAAAASLQGKSHTAGVLHPGHPSNVSTHKVQWAAAVAGEVSAHQTVPGTWSSVSNPIKQDEISNYLISAHMMNPEHLSNDERRQWMRAHQQGMKIGVDRLSLKAQARKASGELPLNPAPEWTDDLQPAKSYDAMFENTPFPTNWGQVSAALAKDWALDHENDPEWKKSVNDYIEKLYEFDAATQAFAKSNPAQHLSPGHVRMAVQKHFSRLQSEKAADDLIPHYVLDPSFSHTPGAHASYGVVNDKNDEKFIFKESPDGSAYRAEVEKLGTDLGQVFGYPSASSEVLEFDHPTKGKVLGVLQHRVDQKGDLDSMALESLDDKQLGQVAQEHILDWMLSNDDGKGDNVLVSQTSQIVGIDKGRTFRKYGTWKGMSTKSSDLNTNATTVWSRVLDKVRAHKISQESFNAMYLAAIARAQRIQKSNPARLEPILDRGLANRDSYGGKSDINAAEVKKRFYARKANLVNDVTGMFQTLSDEAGYGKLPEPPSHVLGEQHSGVQDERHHEVVLSTGAFGKSTSVAGAKGGFVHSYKVIGADGKTQVHNDIKVTEFTMKKNVMPFLNTNGAPMTVTPVEDTEPVIPNMNVAYNKILLGARAVSREAVGKDVDPAFYEALEQARAHVQGDLKHIEDHQADGTGMQSFPSGALVDAEHVSQYALSLQHYADLIDKVDTAKANHDKTKRDEFSAYTPPAYAKNKVVLFNPVSNEKYTELDNGKYIFNQNGKVSQVEESEIPLSYFAGANGWQKIESAPAVVPTSAYKIEFEDASQQQGNLDADGQLTLNNTHFTQGHTGQHWSVTNAHGDQLLITDHDETNTSWTRQGEIKVIFKDVPDSTELAASWDRVTPMLEAMGVKLDEATAAHKEADYWKAMSNIYLHQHISQAVTDSAIGKKADKLHAYKEIKKRINARLAQYGITTGDYQGVKLSANAKFEALDELSKTFASVEDEADWYRNMYAGLFGEQSVHDFVGEEKYLPNFDHHDHNNLELETGKPWHERFDVKESDWKGKGRLLGHSFHHGDGDAGPIGKSGSLLSTEARLRVLGKWLPGQSSASDQARNSATHIFSRWVGPENTGQYNNIFLSPKYAMRLENYAMNWDHYGSWSLLGSKSFPDPLHLQQATMGSGGSGDVDSLNVLAHSNEVMLHDAVPLWDSELIVLGEEGARQKLISDLKKKGIDKILGAPLEERIVLRQKFEEAVENLKQKWGLTW